MPYVPQESRPPLDEAVDQLVTAIKAESEKFDYAGAYEGLLNYALTRVVVGTMPGRRYFAIAQATGVLENVKQEFYRRFAAPYEDEAIDKNGDLAEYEERPVP